MALPQSNFGQRQCVITTPLTVIPSFEAVHGEPYIYKTPHHPDYQLDRHKTFVDAALHTTAAPAYFAPVDNTGHIMIDGGVWANNPALNALLDTISCFDVLLENIRILSLGTGEETLNLKQAQLTRGINGRGVSMGVPPLFKMSSRAQSKNAIGQAGLLIQRRNVVRVDIDERDQQIKLDDVLKSKKDLPRLAKSAAESTGQLIDEIFLKDECDQFMPSPISSAKSLKRSSIPKTLRDNNVNTF